MRILFTTRFYPPNVVGGGELSLAFIAEALARRGHEVSVLSFDGSEEREIRGVHVRRTTLPKGRLALRLAVLKALRSRPKVDLIHAYNLFAYDVLGLLAPVTSAPVIATLNNYPRLLTAPAHTVSVASRMLGRLGQSAWRGFRKLVAVSDTVKEAYLRSGVAEHRIVVVPNFLPAGFYGRNTERHGSTIAYLGRLHAVKGVDVLINAFARLSERRALTLLICGDGPERAGLEVQASRLGLADRVRFLGQLSHAEAQEVVDRSLFLVHPGRWAEPFGRTVLEAMARSTPILVSDLGEPPKLVGDERLIFQAENVDLLSERMRMLIDDPDLRQQLGRALLSRAQAYDEGRVVPRLVAAYESIERNA